MRTGRTESTFSWPSAASHSAVATRILGVVLLLLSLTATALKAQSLPGYSPPAYPDAANTVPPANTASQLPLYATRQAVFAIPFTVDRRVARPVEVHLYVSIDQGNTWQLYARQTPTARQFTFRADGDKEYWFSSRTLDGTQRTQAQNTLKPELRVVVDTVSPQMEVTVRPGQGGEVLTSWQAYDQNLLASSLKLEYQESVGQPWKPVAVQRPDDRDERSDYQGQLKWWPETRSPTINIRAEIRDRAGNQAVVNRRLLLPALVTQQSVAGNQASRRPASEFARYGQPSAGAVPWLSDRQGESGARSAFPQTPGMRAVDRGVAASLPNDRAGNSPGFAAPPCPRVPGTTGNARVRLSDFPPHHARSTGSDAQCRSGGQCPAVTRSG